MLQPRPRIGSVDSGMYSAAPSNSRHLRSTSVESKTAPGTNKMHSMNSSAASWKQLNDGLNHLFPVQNKKSSLPNRPLGSCNPATAYGSQNRMPELRKSSSRSSLYDELESSEDVDQRYHTVTGMPNRKNTLVALPQMAMQTRNPMLDGGLVMRNDEEMRILAPSPIPWTGLTQGTSPESRPVLVNGVSCRRGRVVTVLRGPLGLADPWGQKTMFILPTHRLKILPLLEMASWIFTMLHGNFRIFKTLTAYANNTLLFYYCHLIMPIYSLLAIHSLTWQTLPFHILILLGACTVVMFHEKY